MLALIWRTNSFVIRKAACHKFSTNPLPTLTLYTKKVCPLCDEAKFELRPYEHLFHFEQIFIDQKENKQWFHLYKHDIPVFHLNGEFLMKHKVDHEVLKRELTKCQR